MAKNTRFEGFQLLCYNGITKNTKTVKKLRKITAIEQNSNKATTIKYKKRRKHSMHKKRITEPTAKIKGN